MHKIIAAYRNFKHAVQPYNNDRGFIMGAVILLSLILLVIVTMAIWSTNNESHMVRNTSITTQEFYDAESGIVSAINHSGMWLTSEFIGGPSDTTYAKLRVYSDGTVVVFEARPGSTVGTDPTGAGIRQIAEVQIRKIDNYDTGTGDPVIIAELWDEANKYPDMAHVGAGGGGSTSGRFYVITSKNVGINSQFKSVETGNAAIQVGVVQTVASGP